MMKTKELRLFAGVLVVISFSALLTALTNTSEILASNIHKCTKRDKNETTTDHESNHQNYVYSETRTDRSGSVVHDMIYAKAYAFRHNLTYVGACSKKRAARRQQSTHERGIRALGLEDALRFYCPGIWQEETYQRLDSKAYRNDAYLTQEFLHHLQSLRTQRQEQPEDTSSKVVMHIRRGDVTPCHHMANYSRYSPNQLYLEVLAQQVMSNSSLSCRPDQVQVLSESRSPAEAFDKDFSQYTLDLDGSFETTWRKMADAEVLIMATSSFSYVPALLNKNTVIYTPFWHKPASGWTLVDQDILDRASTKREELCKLQRMN